MEVLELIKFVKEIRKRRRRAKITLHQLANAIDTSVSTIARWERVDYITIRIEELIKVSEYIAAVEKDLLIDEDDNEDEVFGG